MAKDTKKTGNDKKPAPKPEKQSREHAPLPQHTWDEVQKKKEGWDTLR